MKVDGRTNNIVIIIKELSLRNANDEDPPRMYAIHNAMKTLNAVVLGAALEKDPDQQVRFFTEAESRYCYLLPHSSGSYHFYNYTRSRIIEAPARIIGQELVMALLAKEKLLNL